MDVRCGSGRLERTAPTSSDVAASYTGSIRCPCVEITQRIERSNLKVAVGCGEDLSRFTTGSFDAVYFHSVFHWISDQKLALRECRRMLYKAGRVGISGASKEPPHDLDVIVARALSLTPSTSVSAPHTIDQQELAELFERAPASASR